MPIQYLDGRRFRQAVVAGADWVRHTREHLNRINVFPVADGDTGTNMALSLSATAVALQEVDERHLGATAQRAAEASILGAKGNSGVIMAHWFLGLAEAFGSSHKLRAGGLGDALAHASGNVYSAIDEPVEGTIVTVMKAVSDHASTTAAQEHDLAVLLDALVEAGGDALSRTPEQLPVLRKANVVDAGAQGYVNFLEGAARAVRGEPAPAVSESVVHHSVEHAAAHDDDDISERFCTEVVVRGKRFDAERLRRKFRPLGSSLLLATTGDVFKLHVHTNHPDEVMRVAARLGTIEERKVDDMARQRDERHIRHAQPILPLERQPGTVAVLCDSTADLPRESRVEHGIEMAPLQVLFGDEVYRDQVDLSTQEFYSKLQDDSRHPTTSQPPPREFVEALDRIRPDREAVVVTISAGVSGTHKSALHAARLVSHPRVEVFDSASASLGHGIMTLNAARLARQGASLEDVVHWLTRWREDTGLVFSLASLEYLRRGGRIGAAKSLIGALLGVRPILTFDAGRIVPLAKARTSEEAFDQVMAEVERRLPAGACVRLGLIEIGACAFLDHLEQRVRAHCEVLECVRGAPTGVVGVHAGPGAWGVFYQRVRNDDPLKS